MSVRAADNTLRSVNQLPAEGHIFKQMPLRIRKALIQLRAAELIPCIILYLLIYQKLRYLSI